MFLVTVESHSADAILQSQYNKYTSTYPHKLLQDGFYSRSCLLLFFLVPCGKLT